MQHQIFANQSNIQLENTNQTIKYGAVAKPSPNNQIQQAIFD
jgi:hypothetical protein